MSIITRRRLITSGIVAAAGAGLWWQRHWLPTRGLMNPCLPPELPPEITEHPAIANAFEGLETGKMHDWHVHLLGTGDEASDDIWINPQMDDPLHPLKAAQKSFYLNASCPPEGQTTDSGYVTRVRSLLDAQPGGHLMLMAFDFHHGVDGSPDRANSTFRVSNEHAERVASQHERLDWICSIHPYREDAVERLEASVASGARAVKWLPPAMGMDPSSSRCDPFYEAMNRLGIPLLTHGGDELAVEGEEHQRLGNPWLLRRPLEHGVRVIVAHCASLGTGTVPDQLEATAKSKPNFELWLDMMAVPAWEGLLFGEISATTQLNRAAVLPTLLEREDLHDRLVNGSDYPLVGIPPLFSERQLIDLGLLKPSTANVVFELQRHNPLLFDFVLKRNLSWHGKRFPGTVFESTAIPMATTA
jgi:mannonate dehydratase